MADGSPAPDGRHETSLRRQLLIWLLGPMLLIVPLLGTLQYWFIVKPAKLELDQQLGDIAVALSQLLRVEHGELRLEMTPQTERSLRTDQFDAVYFVVVGPTGQIIAGDKQLAAVDIRKPPNWRGFTEARLGQQDVRIGMFDMPCGNAQWCQIRVAETQVKQRQVRDQALITTLAIVIALGVLTVLAAVFAVTRGLQPLSDLRLQLAERSLHDLRPLDAGAAPREVRPLVSALNQLFQRLRDASAAQKAFITDAAHQLRTPLAALKTESELALLEPHPESTRPTLERINQSASRAARLAVQLLALARLDPDARDARGLLPIDLKDAAAATARQWSAQAITRGIDLGFDLDSAVVDGDETLLQELLSNLVHNALEYAGRGATVTVKTYLADGRPTLEVEDDGPGIAPDERPRMLRRFVRGRRAEGHGSGLGLAIVSDIADIHDARLSMETPATGRGLIIRLEFPRRRAASEHS
ncbi:MAG: sensor histidine kinase [Burkholderiaceae bacterium]